ncbi:hypothetical protein MRY87_07270 [bacterium]|nr:hypothetical protein [bacterium]
MPAGVEQISAPRPDPLPPISGTASGYLPGEFSVNEIGGAVYELPIAMVPGTNGVKPKISLVYGSRGGSTIAGLGWSLSGLSSITRCPTTLAQDGFIDGVDFDGSDRFCLDGQRLIAVSGGYGSNGTEYRTENERFSQVFSYGSAGSGPREFVVRTKNGFTFSYGITSDSRREAQGRADVLQWQVARVEDTHGNYYEVSYSEDNTIGENYPLQIRYTGNSSAGLSPYNTINFHYEGRQDTTPHFTGGAKETLTKRLRQIEVLADGALQWSYDLDYGQDGVGRPKLLSVERCDHGIGCTAPTTFDWSADSIGIGPSRVWQNSPDPDFDMVRHTSAPYIYTDLIDMNGDGLPDRVSYKDINNPGNQAFYVYLNTGAGFGSAQVWHDSPLDRLDYVRYGNGTDTYTAILDMNADGLPDRVSYQDIQNPGSKAFYVYLNTGTGFGAGQIWYDSPDDRLDYVRYGSGGDIYCDLLDMNGDGLPDRVSYKDIHNPGGRAFYVYLNTGSGFGSGQIWYDSTDDDLDYFQHGSGPTNYTDLIDMNGDGLPDRVAHRDLFNPYDRGFYVSINTGSGFQSPQRWYNSPTVELNFSRYAGSTGIYSELLDMNGDRLPDRVSYEDVRAPGARAFYVHLNTGTGFENAVAWYSNSGNSVNRYFVYPQYSGSGGIVADLVDMNGDGMPDRVSFKDLFQPLDKAFRVSLNTGDGFEPAQIWYDSPGFFLDYIQHSNGSGVFADIIDMNGDGLPDRVSDEDLLNPNEKAFHVSLNQARAPVLEQITNGHGKTITVEHTFLTDSSTYSLARNATYPARDISGPIAVVARYSESNGIGGVRSTRYHYDDLKYTLDGRGFCGFRQISALDEITGIETVTTYRQDHPWKSLPFRFETFLPNGQIKNRTEDTWTVRHFAHGGYFPYVHRSVEEEYDLQGTLLNTKTTTKDYDDYGNPTRIGVAHSSGHSLVTSNTYQNDTSNWWLGRLLASTVVHTAPGQAPVTRSSAFGYDAQTGTLREETVQPAHPTLERTIQYTHDPFGNITTRSLSGTGVATRVSGTVYDARGQFVTESTNALAHLRSKLTDKRHGGVTSLTLPNNLTTRREYDQFGRVLHEYRPDRTEHRTRYYFVQGGMNAPPHAVYFQREESSGSSPVITYFDRLDRKIRVETVGFNGQKIFVDTHYNDRGEVWRISEPYFEGNSPLWTVLQYDAIGRVTKETAPGTRETVTRYSGYTTTTVDPLTHTSTQTVNALGQLVQSRDHFGHEINYLYNSAGNLIQITDPLQNVTTMRYDVLGNRIEIDDPDSGVTLFGYNAFGELISTTTAEGDTTTFTYDLLGRMIERVEVEGTSTWVYDGTLRATGKLSRAVSAEGNHSVETYYDFLGRRYRTTEQIGAHTFHTSRSYDRNGRLAIITYPTGFQTRYHYTDGGDLKEVTDGSETLTYWELEAENARGQVERHALGNGLVTHRSYDPNTGSLTDIQTGTVQDLSYLFDKVGNLKRRQDRLMSITEEFTYDALYRLTRAEVLGATPQDMTYDEIGNIQTLSGVGTYRYGENGAGPHALTTVVGMRNNTYQYDRNGNRTDASQGTIRYTSYNKPKRIVHGSARRDFFYGADRKRFQTEKRFRGNLDLTKYYVGDLFEREREGSVTRDRHFIRGRDHAVIAVYTESSSASDTLSYLHRDHLGSVQSITDDSGAVLETHNYDAWGARRLSDWTPSSGIISSAVERGFTGHEMLDDIELIHMNGRVYDPVVGRFLSADPVVQAPDNTQSLNRYSYVLNNPLSLTDPSGFVAEEKKKKNSAPRKDQVNTSSVVAVTGPWNSGESSASGGATLGAGSFEKTIANNFIAGSIVVSNGGSASDLARSGRFSELLEAGFKASLLSGDSVHIFGEKVNVTPFLSDGGKNEHQVISPVFLQVTDATRKRFNRTDFQATAVAVAGGDGEELRASSFSNGAVTTGFAGLYDTRLLKEGAFLPAKGLRLELDLGYLTFSNSDRAPITKLPAREYPKGDYVGSFIQGLLPVHTAHLSHRPILGSPKAQVEYGRAVAELRKRQVQLQSVGGTVDSLRSPGLFITDFTVNKIGQFGAKQLERDIEDYHR